MSEFGHFTPAEVVPDPFAAEPLLIWTAPSLPDPFAEPIPQGFIEVVTP